MVGKNAEGRRKNLGEAICFYREKKGLSMRELSGITGIDVAYISRLESSEKKNPSVQVIKVLSHALDVELYDFVEFDTGQLLK